MLRKIIQKRNELLWGLMYHLHILIKYPKQYNYLDNNIGITLNFLLIYKFVFKYSQSMLIRTTSWIGVVSF